MDQYVFSPAEFFGHEDIELAGQVVFAFFQDDDIMRPADFLHQWCKFFQVLIVQVEFPRLHKLSAEYPVIPENQAGYHWKSA